jgi:hypothetical protein
MTTRLEKYISLFCYSQVAVKALQDAKPRPPLVQRRQKPLNDTFTHQSAVLFWVPGYPGIRGKDRADKLAKEESGHQVVWSELALGFWSQNIKQNIKCWINNQYMKMWQGFRSTWRNTRVQIPVAKTRLLSFKGTQSTVVTSFWTGVTPVSTSLSNEVDWQCGV